MTVGFWELLAPTQFYILTAMSLAAVGVAARDNAQKQPLWAIRLFASIGIFSAAHIFWFTAGQDFKPVNLWDAIVHTVLLVAMFTVLVLWAIFSLKRGPVTSTLSAATQPSPGSPEE